jgi:hypothetical protein
MSIFSDIGNLIGNDIKSINAKIANTVDAWFSDNGDGTVDVKKHLVPTDATISLGTIDKPFADVFISESSLYVNGTKVLSEDAGTINLSADDDQNIRITTGGGGDIEFYPSGTGNIEMKGNLELAAGKKILTSDGNALVIDEDISVQNISSPTITALNDDINDVVLVVNSNTNSIDAHTTSINTLSSNLTNEQSVRAAADTALDLRVSSLETLTTSNDLNLDTVQEIVTFIKQNRSDLDSISLDWSSVQNKPTEISDMGTLTDFDNALNAAMA